jgi:hypothetical protein
MKKVSLLFIGLLSVVNLFAQSGINQPNIGELKGRKITSIVENKTVGSTAISMDGSKTDAPAQGTGPSKTEKLTWEIVFENKNAGTFSASKKLKRINFILDRPFGILKYDSDNSFESTDGSERLVKKFTDQLGNVSTHVLSVKDNTYEKDLAVTSKTDLLWNSNLPVYDANLYWNGLLLILPSSVKLEKGATWKSSVTLPDRSIENLFVVTHFDLNSAQITIKSKEVYTSEQKSLNAEGAPSGMSLGLKTKQKTFDGTININIKTGLITEGKFQTETISDLSLNGEASERKSYSITNISNTLK